MLKKLQFIKQLDFEKFLIWGEISKFNIEKPYFEKGGGEDESGDGRGSDEAVGNNRQALLIW